MSVFNPIDHFGSILSYGIFEFFPFLHSIFRQFFWIADFLSRRRCNIFKLLFLRFPKQLFCCNLNPIDDEDEKRDVRCSLYQQSNLRRRHFIFNLQRRKEKTFRSISVTRERGEIKHTGTIFGPLAGLSSSMMLVGFSFAWKEVSEEEKKESAMTKEEPFYCV